MLIAFVVLVESPCVVGLDMVSDINISVWLPTHVVDLYVNHRFFFYLDSVDQHIDNLDRDPEGLMKANLQV